MITAPDKVGVGQPFLVRMVFPYLVDDIEVIWNDMSLHPSIEYSGETSSSMILLGTRLAEGPARRSLRVNVIAGRAVESCSKEINITSHKYKKETLSVAPRMVKPPQDMQERIKLEHESSLKAALTFSVDRQWSVPFSLPVKGKMLSRFGLYRVFNNELKSRHKGLDFRAGLGTPVSSVAPGKIVMTGHDFYYGGNCVYVDHGNGVVSSYQHLSKILVKEGEQVQRGDRIGLAGSSGRTTGAHLHLSVYANGVNIDPAPLFRMGQ
ncbi:M23 family metallopeptidase [Maridesulfovibrio sp. FT414]|uniref:M23 family metallopeptidase n=1 Tax=Maridesulfovibrio sp. FT414 TaxID=2979469 RepID=UPI003D80939F